MMHNLPPKPPKADTKQWRYAGWLVIADGYENSGHATSQPVFQCLNRGCHALVQGHNRLLVEHEQGHKRRAQESVT